MPRKTKPQPIALVPLPAGVLHLFDKEPKAAHESNATVMALKKAPMEPALSGQMSHHPGCAPGASRPQTASKQRNGTGARTVYAGEGPLRIELPREREASFEPILSRGAGSRCSSHHLAGLHRAPDAQQPGLCKLERAQGPGRSHQAEPYRAGAAAAALDAFEAGP